MKILNPKNVDKTNIIIIILNAFKLKGTSVWWWVIC